MGSQYFTNSLDKIKKMEISTALDLINSKLGKTTGNILSLTVAFIVLYGFLVKSGIIEHISLITTYRKRKKDKLIASKEVLIKESLLDEETKNHVTYHQNVLYLQRELDIEEKDLNILKYLNGYIDKNKAIDTFKQCRNLITYNKITQRIEPKDNINIGDAEKNRLIGSIIYFTISGLSFFSMFYISSKFVDSLKDIFDLLFLVILSTSALCGGVYIAFKILTYFMRLKYVEWLLEMERIE